MANILGARCAVNVYIQQFVAVRLVSAAASQSDGFELMLAVLCHLRMLNSAAAAAAAECNV